MILSGLKMLTKYFGIYPVDSSDYEELRNFEKLQLNDASLVWDRDNHLIL